MINSVFKIFSKFQNFDYRATLTGSNSREYVYNTQLTAGGSPDATFYNNSTSQNNSHGKFFVFRIRINTHKDIVRSFRTLLHFSIFIVIQAC